MPRFRVRLLGGPQDVGEGRQVEFASLRGVAPTALFVLPGGEVVCPDSIASRVPEALARARTAVVYFRERMTPGRPGCRLVYLFASGWEDYGRRLGAPVPS